MINNPESKENNLWTRSYIITPPGNVQVHLTVSVDLGGLNHVKSEGELSEGKVQLEMGRRELSAEGNVTES